MSVRRDRDPDGMQAHDQRPVMRASTRTTRTPTWPTCCVEHRAAAVDLLDTCVTNDVATIVADLITGGTTRDGAVDAIDHSYRPWLLHRINAAIDLGIDLGSLGRVA